MVLYAYSSDIAVRVVSVFLYKCHCVRYGNVNVLVIGDNHLIVAYRLIHIGCKRRICTEKARAVDCGIKRLRNLGFKLRKYIDCRIFKLFFCDRDNNRKFLRLDCRVNPLAAACLDTLALAYPVSACAVCQYVKLFLIRCHSFGFCHTQNR